VDSHDGIPGEESAELILEKGAGLIF
jgi:hypothetical protein